MNCNFCKVFPTSYLKLDTFVGTWLQTSPCPTLNKTTATKGKLLRAEGVSTAVGSPSPGVEVPGYLITLSGRTLTPCPFLLTQPLFSHFHGLLTESGVCSALARHTSEKQSRGLRFHSRMPSGIADSKQEWPHPFFAAAHMAAVMGRSAGHQCRDSRASCWEFRTV